MAIFTAASSSAIPISSGKITLTNAPLSLTRSYINPEKETDADKANPDAENAFWQSQTGCKQIPFSCDLAKDSFLHLTFKGPDLVLQLMKTAKKADSDKMELRTITLWGTGAESPEKTSVKTKLDALAA
jgi:hypothetical protein